MISYLEAIESNIPIELKQVDRWVVWRYDEQHGRTIKVPYVAKSKWYRRAAVNDPSTWCGFDDAWDAYQKKDGIFQGVGLVFDGSDGLVGVDLDDCHDPRTLEMAPAAEQLIESLATYAEFSPSYTGVKLIGKTSISLAGLRKKGTVDGLNVEIYDNLRFFTITGCVVTPALPVQSIDKSLPPLLQAIDRASSLTTAAKVGSGTELPNNVALRRVIERLKGVQRSGNGWSACCPAHADRSPSLSVSIGSNGQVLLHCHRGCGVEKVAQSLGLRLDQLFH